MIKTIYYDNDIKDIDGFSMFLAGLTPRSKDVKSWGPDFVSQLKSKDIIKELFGIDLTQYKK